MTPADLLRLTVRPVLVWMGEPYASAEAELMLLAIAGQESGCSVRAQRGGSALGLWQFEWSGVRGLAGPDAKLAGEAARFCCPLGAPPEPMVGEVHRLLGTNDQMACVVARLLLWSDPYPLPKVGEEDKAWSLYLRLWRPGRPRPEAWTASYAAAFHAVAGPELVA